MKKNNHLTLAKCWGEVSAQNTALCRQENLWTCRWTSSDSLPGNTPRGPQNPRESSASSWLVPWSLFHSSGVKTTGCFLVSFSQVKPHCYLCNDFLELETHTWICPTSVLILVSALWGTCLGVLCNNRKHGPLIFWDSDNFKHSFLLSPKYSYTCETMYLI